MKTGRQHGGDYAEVTVPADTTLCHRPDAE